MIRNTTCGTGSPPNLTYKHLADETLAEASYLATNNRGVCGSRTLRRAAAPSAAKGDAPCRGRLSLTAGCAPPASVRDSFSL